jgi:hypothetical protein
MTKFDIGVDSTDTTHDTFAAFPGLGKKEPA